MHLFGRSPDVVSRIANHVMHHIYDTLHHLLDSFDHDRLTPDVLERLALAVHARGGLHPDIWGFIDGTVRPISRPTEHQRQVYNGHKRVHALKYQSVVTPDGIISHMTGPWVGRRHDARMLGESGLCEELELWAHAADGRPMRLYGDPAYGQTTFILCPFKGKLVASSFFLSLLTFMCW